MYGHLKRLSETVKGTQLVERLMCAGSLSERVKICETAKTTPEFQEFIKHYEDAIAEGATLVRVGTALFGPRPPMGTR